MSEQDGPEDEPAGLRERELARDAVFSKKPVSIERGDGVHVEDTDGNEYLDMGASYGVMAVGHGHPRVVDAIREQAERLTYVQGSYPTEVRADAYDAIADATPDGLDRVFMANAGTEVNEAALKFARASTAPEKTRFVAAKRGFHGRTYGSISVTWKKKYRGPFAPTVPDVEFVPFDDAEALRDAVDDETAAVILEPVQGEGGIHPASAAFLEAAREACDDHGACLIFDEIQAGLGRTGEMWSHEHHDVTPDALTTAKSLGGGYPVSAIACTEEMTAIPSGSHGGTYNGNPMAAAATKAVLDVIREEGLAANAAAMGDRLVDGLRGIDSDRVVAVRGEGLMVGVQVKGRSGRLLSGLAQEGVLALPAGKNVVRFLPPLTLEERHVDRAVDAMAEVL